MCFALPNGRADAQTAETTLEWRRWHRYHPSTSRQRMFLEGNLLGEGRFRSAAVYLRASRTTGLCTGYGLHREFGEGTRCYSQVLGVPMRMIDPGALLLRSTRVGHLGVFTGTRGIHEDFSTIKKKNRVTTLIIDGESVLSRSQKYCPCNKS